MDEDTTQAAWEQAAQEEQQQMTTELGAIAKALAAAQAEMQNPSFDSTNPHFRSRFSSLAAVRNAVVPVLAKHGICMTQDLTAYEKGVMCRTILTHESGQQMVFGPLPMPATKPDAHGLGSAATFARRYALMAVAGVVGDDDDANEATGKPAQAEPIDKAADAEKTQYAVALKKAVQAIDADKVWKIHLDLHAEGEEFYRSVWERLDATTRGKAKDFIDLKKREAA